MPDQFPESRKRSFWWPFHVQNPFAEQAKESFTGEISEEDQKAFFDRLRTARIEANLTQAQVAKKLGRYQSYISQMESGKRRLLIEDFYILFRLYNKPPEYFYSVFSK
ncbi:helix-turn-helix transcriptional regulator [Leptospira ellisii]|uniref:Helix-turn-helix transcriptional regulator n=1 Tax=Leptospira ellisii TaxID=2023197 RepID=A0AAE4QQ75_9LEPT|nr:helix-turn-helix transcriptional regulator [Leptospira ellisii]MDV6237204.1 helix-turn-helix transcriptional regulator [Leptospira ellisii]